MHARSAGHSSTSQSLRRLLGLVAVVTVGGIAGCTSSKVVRAPINAAQPCPAAQFLYTDWTERGRGSVGVYRCSPEVVVRGEANQPEDRQEPSLVTRRP